MSLQIQNSFPLFHQHPDLIYLDSAATALKPQVVLEAERKYSENFSTNAARGLYPLAENTSEALQDTRNAVAQFLNASSEEIIFSHGTTDGINTLVHALENTFSETTGKILTPIDGHHSLILPLQEWSKRKKYTFDFTSVTEDGFLSEEDLLEKLSEDTLVIGLTLVSNVYGVRQDITSLVKKIREKNSDVFILLDAAQGAPHTPIDVQELGVDALVFSGHKLYGSTGVGVSYLKKDWQERLIPGIFGGGMVLDTLKEPTQWKSGPEKFEAGTLPLAQIFGLHAAIEYIQNIGFSALQEHEGKILVSVVTKLQEAFGTAITFLGTTDPSKKIGLLSFTLEGIHPHDIATLLGEKNICVRAGEHCASFLHRSLNIPATTRISFGPYTEESDIDILVKELREIFEKMKK